MHRAAALSFALLFGSSLLAAQAGGQKDMQAAVVRIAPVSGSCPVSFHAQQSSAAFSREVGGGLPKGVAQSLHLTVTNPDSRQVVAANVTVRGFANKGRMVQTMSGQDSSDAAKTLDVGFTVGPGREISAELRVAGLTAVSTIDLNSVTYEDGSTWKLAAGSSCRSLIDGLMLVSGR